MKIEHCSWEYCCSHHRDVYSAKYAMDDLISNIRNLHCTAERFPEISNVLSIVRVGIFIREGSTVGT